MVGYTVHKMWYLGVKLKKTLGPYLKGTTECAVNFLGNRSKDFKAGVVHDRAYLLSAIFLVILRAEASKERVEVG